jgi:osmoprotectant transport system permease protein
VSAPVDPAYADPLDSASAASTAAVPDVDRSGRRALLAQPVLVLLGLLAFIVWRANADLSETESRQLGWEALRRSAAEHLWLTLASTAVVLVVALPLGIALTRRRLRRFAPPVLALANTGQAAPAIGLVVLLAAWLGFGFRTAVLALVCYAVLPVLRNTLVGIGGVDTRLVEAARGMGMSATAALFRVELPLAVPVILSGVRTALVLLVGTATLAVFVDGGGFGILITTGVNLYLNSLLISGALLVALLALFVDWVGRVVEHVARPRGL